MSVDERFGEAVNAHAEGKLADARKLYEALLDEDGAPVADIHANLASLAFVERDPQRAERHAREAIRIDPQKANSYNNLGLALKAQGRTDEASAAFQDCFRRDPEHHLALANFAELRARENDVEAALPAIERVLQLAPGRIDAIEPALSVKLNACAWEGLDELIQKCRVALRKGGNVNPYMLFPICLDPEELRVAARTKAAAVARSAADLPPYVPPAANTGKIRVGFLSATMRSHATGYLVREMIEAHDRERFTYICYPYLTPAPDEWTKMLHAQFDEVVDLTDADDVSALERLRADRLDILIDVDAYANGGRNRISAARAAPVQVNWLGYLATMGSPAIDYVIADKLVVPDDLRDSFDEKVVRLPGGFFPSDRQRVVSNRFQSRAELGLPENAVVFCAFNQARKITPPVLHAWAAILANVEGSVLWLWDVTPMATRNLINALAAAGVDRDHIVTTPSMPLPDHLCRYRFADVFLDTSPYNGHTMSSDALYMGVPAVTLRGRTFPSRVAAGLLTRLGLEAFVADDLRGYAERAVALGRDPELRKRIRAHLANGRKPGSVFDGVRFAREFEAALAVMAERARSGQPPAHIDI